MKLLRNVMMILAVMVSTMAFAQKENFSGTIVDSTGEPIIGATVKVKGTTLPDFIIASPKLEI